MADKSERTLVLLKPDALQRGLVGTLVGRLETRGLKIVAMKLLLMDRDLAGRHYEAHVRSPFYPGLVEFITSGPLIAMVVEGPGAVNLVRTTMGATNPLEAAPGTIRGDLATDIGRNLIHGSDSPQAAQREIALFFDSSEMIDYSRGIDPWVTES